MDWMALGFLGSLFFAFIPAFYWPDPDWRTAAEEVFKMQLPPVLSVQPLVSLEAWLLALAGFGWFYSATGWEINHSGRNRVYFAICLVLGVFGTVVLWGNLVGAKYPTAEESPVFTFFPNRNQTANFLALGGVACFGFAMTAFRMRVVLPLLGLLVAGICFTALVWGISRAGVLLFFIGIIVWYFLQLKTGRVARSLKLGFPLLVIALSVFIVSNSRTTERIVDFVSGEGAWSDDFRVLIAKDSWEMVRAAPLTGHGLGNFASVFPQYRDSSANFQRVVHPESDLLWLLGEAGLIGKLLLIGFLIAYFLNCRGLGKGRSGNYRLVAMAPVVIFLLHGLFDVSGHRPGTVYFAILLAALALPKGQNRERTLHPFYGRICGGILIVFGLLWAASGLFQWPLHSQVAVQVYRETIREADSEESYINAMAQADRWVQRHPLDWRAYSERAKLTLAQSGDRGKAAADFRRARFVEPILGLPAFEEGFVWIPFAASRAIDAWRDAIFRELESPAAAYRRMFEAAEGSDEIRDRLARLSDLKLDLRVYFLSRQSGDFLMQELQRDLKRDAALDHFDRAQRSELLRIWITRGDREAAEAFLAKHASRLDRPWWLWSLLRKEQARFEEAVAYIREAMGPAELPSIPDTAVSLIRLKREFSLVPGDIVKGTALLRFYLQEENYLMVRELTQQMMDAQKTVPLYVDYWHAESYFHLGDFIESWYAYHEYLKRLWEAE